MAGNLIEIFGEAWVAIRIINIKKRPLSGKGLFGVKD